MKKDFSKAFSLVELLIALIIISVITAALAPIISKKLGKNTLTVIRGAVDKMAGGNGKFFEADDPDCVYNPSTAQTTCNFVVPSGVTKLNAILVGGGGGGGGASAYNQADRSVATTITDKAIGRNKYRYSSDKKEVSITGDMVDVKIATIIGGGASGGGGTITNKTKNFTPGHDACEEQGLWFFNKKCIKIFTNIDYDPSIKDLNAICRDRNPIPDLARDDSWTLAPTSWYTSKLVSTIDADGKTKDKNGNAITASLVDFVNRLSIDYRVTWKDGSCQYKDDIPSARYNRYTCVSRWNKPVEGICNGIKSKDLTGVDASSEVAFLAKVTPKKAYNQTIYKGYDEEETNYIPAGPEIYYGFYHSGIDYAVNKDQCARKFIGGWHQIGKRVTYSGYDGSRLYEEVPSSGLTAVCLFNNKISDNQYTGGGGGGAGVYAENITIPQQVIRNNIGGKIVLAPGDYVEGGAGGVIYYKDEDKWYADNWKEGAKQNMALKPDSYFFGESGKNGNDSSVTVYNGSTNVWEYIAKGGEKGTAKTGINEAYAAMGGLGGKCDKLGTRVTCKTGNSGLDPSPRAKTTDEGDEFIKYDASFGGSGGNVSYPIQITNHNSRIKNVYVGNGGFGGDAGKITDENTTDMYENGVDYFTSDGEYGKPGYIVLAYGKKYQAGAGGGGGGGAYVEIKNISVTPGSTVVVKIGTGGTGGDIGFNGRSGTATSITVNGITYTAGAGGYGSRGISAGETTGVYNPAAHGTGGTGGIIDATTSSRAATKVTGYTGDNGSNARMIDGIAQGSVGGRGGKSGFGSVGGCGGYSSGGISSSVSCGNKSVNGLSQVFKGVSILLGKFNYGSAGAGGGGGGWNKDDRYYQTPGYGADGQNGYAYLSWE